MGAFPILLAATSTATSTDSAVDVASEVATIEFDDGTSNVICSTWYGTLEGGGHTKASCLDFCAADMRCRYATFFVDTGYCHIAQTCTSTAQYHDHPISYYKRQFLESAPLVEKPSSDLDSAVDVASEVATIEFDDGTSNVICSTWYGTLEGGGHTKASCLDFCAADMRCRYATFFVDT